MVACLSSRPSCPLRTSREVVVVKALDGRCVVGEVAKKGRVSGECVVSVFEGRFASKWGLHRLLSPIAVDALPAGRVRDTKAPRCSCPTTEALQVRVSYWKLAEVESRWSSKCIY